MLLYRVKDFNSPTKGFKVFSSIRPDLWNNKSQEIDAQVPEHRFKFYTIKTLLILKVLLCNVDEPKVNSARVQEGSSAGSYKN